MGSLLRIPIIAVDDLVETLERANSEGMLTAATVPDENARDITKTDFSAGVIAVIGNEGNGVTEAVKSTARERITIKMKGEAESLNASVAAVITMWEIMR
jgi:RNA methyltransferase, TrmH family